MQVLLVATCVLLAFSVTEARSLSIQARSNVTSEADDYTPCKRQVSVYFDLGDLDADSFQSLQSLLSNQMFSNFNHFERLVVGIYGGGTFDLQKPGTFKSLADVQNYINGMHREGGWSDVDFLFDELADNQVPTGMDQTIIVFMGRLNDQDVKAADHYGEQIKRFAYLSLIGVQDSVTLKNLNKLADYSYTFNVQNPPANIQDVIKQAHGCNA